MQRFASTRSAMADAVLFAVTVKVCKLAKHYTPGDMFDFNARKYKHSVKSVTSTLLSLFEVVSPTVVNMPVWPLPKTIKRTY